MRDHDGFIHIAFVEFGHRLRILIIAHSETAYLACENHIKRDCDTVHSVVITSSLRTFLYRASYYN